MLQDHSIVEMIYPDNLELFYQFQWVFPTEYHKKYKNTIKGKSLDHEYLRSLLYWHGRKLISKLWKPKNTLTYQYVLCTGIFYWAVSLPFFRKHRIQRVISNPFLDMKQSIRQMWEWISCK